MLILFVGEFVACTTGGSFLPHLLNVNAGEVCFFRKKKKHRTFTIFLSWMIWTWLCWFRLVWAFVSWMIIWEIGHLFLFKYASIHTRNWGCVHWFSGNIRYKFSGCFDEDHLILSTRASSCLHNFSGWFDIKCYTWAATFFWWYIDVRGVLTFSRIVLTCKIKVNENEVVVLNPRAGPVRNSLAFWILHSGWFWRKPVWPGRWNEHIFS